MGTKPPPKPAPRAGSLSGGASEQDSDEDFDRLPEQAGPSRHVNKAPPEPVCIPLDGKSEYPFRKVSAYLPNWLPPIIFDHLLLGLRDRKVRCVENPENADIFFMYHGMNAVEEAETKAWQQRGEHRTVASTDWFARVDNSGKAHPVPRVPPAFVDDDGRSLLVAVADLANEELRKEVMHTLEEHGAIVVPFSEANTLIVPNGHKCLRRPHPRYKKKKLSLYDVNWVYSTAREASQRRCTSSSVAPVTQTQNKTQKDTRTRAQSTRSASAPQTATGKRKRRESSDYAPEQRQSTPKAPRTEFTSHDRDRLARWLAWQRPTDEGRLSQSLYNRLLKYSEDDPVYGWAARHTPSAWREHYKKNRSTRWKDGTVLDNMILFNVRHGVDFNLTLATERNKQTKKTGGSSKETTGEKARNDKEDSLDAREVEGALLE